MGRTPPPPLRTATRQPPAPRRAPMAPPPARPAGQGTLDVGAAPTPSPPPVKQDDRVHQLSEVQQTPTGTKIVTRCGLRDLPRQPDWNRNPKGWRGLRSVGVTGWGSDVTCEDCLRGIAGRG